MEHPAGNRRDSHQHVATISIFWSFQKASNESMANLLVTPLHAHAHAHEQNALCSRPPSACWNYEAVTNPLLVFFNLATLLLISMKHDKLVSIEMHITTCSVVWCMMYDGFLDCYFAWGPSRCDAMKKDIWRSVGRQRWRLALKSSVSIANAWLLWVLKLVASPILGSFSDYMLLHLDARKT